MFRYGTAALVAFIFCGSGEGAFAGEADDLQNMINRARQGASDLELRDERSVVRDEITLLRVWLDEAWAFRSAQKYDEVRAVLDRCDAQGDMVRQKILASLLAAQVAQKDAALKKLRNKIDETKKAIQAATLQKAALEARAK